MIGTGGDEQYKILNSSPIRHYVLMFDGDPAGRNGAKKFINNIRDDVIVDIITISIDVPIIVDFRGIICIVARRA